ncbi:MAG: Ig-like domain-containing protein [Verrucomicrobiota bacterium]|jgi:hypothetical protein
MENCSVAFTACGRFGGIYSKSPAFRLRGTPGTPGGAAVTLAAGQITYTPASSFIGPDTITYTLSDGCGTAQGTIAVTVLATDLPRQNSISINNTPTSTTVVFAAIPGANYEIQAAFAAEGPWSNLSGPFQAADDGLVQYTDTTYPKPASRFYRTQYISGP